MTWHIDCKEDIVGRREQLERELREWTVKCNKAEERVKALGPPVPDLKEGEDLTGGAVTTEEWVAESASAQKELDTARAKKQEIRDELSQIRRTG